MTEKISEAVENAVEVAVNEAINRKIDGYRGVGIRYHLGNLAVGAVLLAGFLLASSMVETTPWDEPHVMTTALDPIVSDMVARNWRKDDDGHWMVDVYGVKAPSNCVYVKNQTVSAVVATTAPSQEILVTFVDDAIPGNTRPPGYQFFDTWKFESDSLNVYDHVTSIMKHYCPGFGVAATTIGPWKVGVEPTAK